MASLGIIFAAAYMLSLYKKIIFGRIINLEVKKMVDLKNIEIYMLISLAFLILFFGFYPEILFSTIDISIDNLIKNYQLNLNYHLIANK